MRVHRNGDVGNRLRHETEASHPPYFSAVGFSLAILAWVLLFNLLTRWIPSGRTFFLGMAQYSPIILVAAFVLAARQGPRKIDCLNSFMLRVRFGGLVCLVALAAVFASQVLVSCLMLVVLKRPFLGLTGSLVVSAVRKTPLMFLSNLSEETAWRGYLHTCLRRLGLHQRNLWIAMVWWMWHLPNLYLGGGANGQVRSAALLLPTLISSAYVLSWLRERSQSIWPAAVGHFLLNMGGGMAVRLFQTDGTSQWGLSVVVCVGIIVVWGGCATLLWWRFPPGDCVERKESCQDDGLAPPERGQ